MASKILKKFVIKSLQICSSHLSAVATLPWEIQKSQQLTVTSQLSRLQRSQVLYWTSSYSITVYHGSAYTVVRVTSYFYGEWQNWGHQNSETPEPIVTKFDGWLRRRYDPARQNWNRSPQWGRPGKWVKYHSHVVFSFSCDPNFCSRPVSKLQKRFWCCLIHRMPIPGYCIPTGIKLQKNSFSIILPQKGCE